MYISIYMVSMGHPFNPSTERANDALSQCRYIYALKLHSPHQCLSCVDLMGIMCARGKGALIKPRDLLNLAVTAFGDLIGSFDVQMRGDI